MNALPINETKHPARRTLFLTNQASVLFVEYKFFSLNKKQHKLNDQNQHVHQFSYLLSIRTYAPPVSLTETSHKHPRLISAIYSDFQLTKWLAHTKDQHRLQ